MPLANFNPFSKPNAYDLLELRNGPKTTTVEIGRAYTRHMKRARQIKDFEKRTHRMQQLDLARDQLQKPDDRVLLDFFCEDNQCYDSLAGQIVEQLARQPIPAVDVLSEFRDDADPEELMPPSSRVLFEDCDWPEAAWFDAPFPSGEFLPVCNID